MVGDFGLMYYNARWYDPALGRFAQADTIVPGMHPMAFDRFAYVFNNPLRFIDPSGHGPCDDPNTADPECDTEWTDPWKPYKPADVKLTENGAKVAELFRKMQEYKEGWWWKDGSFTLEEFLGLWILHEANGNREIAEILAQVVAQNLYVGGYNDAYCTSSVCQNGAFNFMGAESQLTGGLFTGTTDLSNYLGPPSLLSDPWTSEDVANYGNAALHPTSLNYDRNDAPSNWGNATAWANAMRDQYDIHESGPPNGTSTHPLTVYYYVGSFVIFTINQRHNWNLIGVNTSMDN